MTQGGFSIIRLFKATMNYDQEITLGHGTLFTMESEHAIDGRAHMMYLCDDHMNSALFDYDTNEEMFEHIAQYVEQRGMVDQSYVPADWSENDDELLAALLIGAADLAVAQDDAADYSQSYSEESLNDPRFSDDDDQADYHGENDPF